MYLSFMTNTVIDVTVLDSKLSKRITHSHDPRCGFKTGVPSGERGNLPERPADPTLAPRVSFTPVVLNSSK